MGTNAYNDDSHDGAHSQPWESEYLCGTLEIWDSLWLTVSSPIDHLILIVCIHWEKVNWLELLGMESLHLK